MILEVLLGITSGAKGLKTRPEDELPKELLRAVDDVRGFDPRLAVEKLAGAMLEDKSLASELFADKLAFAERNT